jgi:hypothetical protein
MNGNPIPDNLDWVKARAECSLQHIFKELELGVRQDCEKAQALVPPKYPTTFSVTKTYGTRFAAVRVDDPLSAISRSIYFACSGGKITVSSDGSVGEEVKMTATLTLTNEGHCKLKVGDEELFQWQFRRMALEDLFFNYSL